MSYLFIVLTSVFSANALLVYGLGICPAFRREHRSIGAQILALGLVSLLAVSLFWLLRSFVLGPLSLEALDILLYAVLIAPLLKLLARFIASAGSTFLVRVGAFMDEAVTSCLVLGVALIATRSDFGLLEALAASLSACAGYWLALVVLDSIRERLELSKLPQAFRGAPALLVSAGLMAMAFLGIDGMMIHNLSR